MKLHRRDFLKVSAAMALAGQLPPAMAAATGAASTGLVARTGNKRLVVGKRELEMPVWGYGGTSPGQTLTVDQGDMLDVRLKNELPEDTSIHWHGIRTPNAMDGVPHVTQPPVAVGAEFPYRFRCEDAGTYWYHPHANSAEQIGRGLFGPLIVREEKPVEVDRDLVWVMADWQLGQDGTLSEDFSGMHDNSHGGRMGNLVTVNGDHKPVIPLQPGERVRLRLINAAAARIMSFDFPGLDGWWIALDGQPIAPRGLAGSPVYVPPGGRADVVLDIPPDGATNTDFQVIDATYRNQNLRVATFKTAGKVVRHKPLPAPAKMPDNPLARPDLDGAEMKVVTFEGGAMGGLRSAMLDDKQMSIRDLAGRGVVWATNGRIWSSLEEIAAQEKLFKLQTGKSYVFRLQNRTAFPHPIHLHGHTFQVIARAGKKLATPVWRDTVLVFPDEQVDIAFVADNPGVWLMHCHILGHVTAGMIAAIEVG